MRIYFVRHGQTEWNLQKRIQGRRDTPLNEQGKQQAMEARQKLMSKNIDLIICSPLLRTVETAEIINKDRNIPILYDNRIIERYFGELEGNPISSVDFNSFWDYYKNLEYKNIETMQELFKRVYLFLEDIKNKYKDKNILIVSHGGVGMPMDCFFSKIIPNGSLREAGLLFKNCEVKEYEL